jgi:hypothetical protein
VKAGIMHAACYEKATGRTLRVQRNSRAVHQCARCDRPIVAGAPIGWVRAPLAPAMPGVVAFAMSAGFAAGLAVGTMIGGGK